MKLSISDTDVELTFFLSMRIGFTASGCNLVSMPRFMSLSTTATRIIFMPPAVLVEDPPIKKSVNNRALLATGQILKFAFENPVVVRKDTVWNVPFTAAFKGVSCVFKKSIMPTAKETKRVMER